MKTQGIKTLLVQGDKTFKIEIPDYAKVTFGPFSPPTKGRNEQWASSGGNKGTLRIYGKTKTDVLGVFAGVTEFRDISKVNYSEQIAKEEGAIIWKSDNEGYQREEKVKRESQWVDPTKLLPGKAK